MAIRELSDLTPFKILPDSYPKLFPPQRHRRVAWYATEDDCVLGVVVHNQERKQYGWATLAMIGGTIPSGYRRHARSDFLATQTSPDKSAALRQWLAFMGSPDWMLATMQTVDRGEDTLSLNQWCVRMLSEFYAATKSDGTGLTPDLVGGYLFPEVAITWCSTRIDAGEALYEAMQSR
jgi:hypothetical protein